MFIDDSTELTERLFDSREIAAIGNEENTIDITETMNPFASERLQQIDFN